VDQEIIRTTGQNHSDFLPRYIQSKSVLPNIFIHFHLWISTETLCRSECIGTGQTCQNYSVIYVFVSQLQLNRAFCLGKAKERYI